MGANTLVYQEFGIVSGNSSETVTYLMEELRFAAIYFVNLQYTVRGGRRTKRYEFCGTWNPKSLECGVIDFRLRVFENIRHTKIFHLLRCINLNLTAIL